MTTTPSESRSTDEIITALVAALAIAKGRNVATVRCEFGLDPISAPISEIGSRTDAQGAPTRQGEMRLSA